MSYFYLVALLPLIVGAVLVAWHREVHWLEFIGSSALAFFLAGMFHAIAIRSQVGDYETWSGQIVSATHHPRWVEQTTYTTTDDKGNTTTHYIYTTHPEHWTADTSTGESHGISNRFFDQVLQSFGGRITTERPYKSGFYSGDRNIYVSYNATQYVYPTTAWRYFENRTRAVPNLFQFTKVPPGERTYEYPANTDWRQSDRLVGPIRSRVDITEFDRLNTRIGPTSKANLILVGFKGRAATAGPYQQAAWGNGRKNDIVLCFDADQTPPAWTFAFGWTEQEIVKRTLESLALEHGVSTKTLPLFEEAIRTHYRLKDWSKFDYINIPPPAWALWWFPLALIATQAGYWTWALTNDVTARTKW